MRIDSADYQFKDSYFIVVHIHPFVYVLFGLLILFCVILMISVIKRRKRKKL
jgi:heme/copper-type cytochrome/quinol oxidase subunit 1